MKKFTIYLGLNDKDTKIPKYPTESGREIAQSLAAQHVGAATTSICHGVYTHDSGEIVLENTVRIELLMVEKDTVKKFVDILKTTFNQESVLVEITDIDSDLW